VIPFDVDYLTLSMPVDADGWAERVRWSRTFRIEGAAVDLAVGWIGGALRAKIEFNPARLADPYRWMACSAAEAVAVTTELLRERILPIVPIVGGAMGAKVARIDVTRDLWTERPEFYIGGLFGLRRSYDKLGELLRDPRRNGALTVIAGSPRGGIVKLYDKGAEMIGAPPGTLRFEASCRGWARRYGGILRLRDVTDDSVSRLGMNRWDWSRFGTEVAATQAVVERALRMGWTQAQVERVLGRLLARAQMRLPASAGSDRIERLCRELQMVMTLDPPWADGHFIGVPGSVLREGTATTGCAERAAPRIAGTGHESLAAVPRSLCRLLGCQTNPSRTHGLGQRGSVLGGGGGR
jgi:hypothetical protein